MTPEERVGDKVLNNSSSRLTPSDPTALVTSRSRSTRQIFDNLIFHDFLGEFTDLTEISQNHPSKSKNLPRSSKFRKSS